MGFDSGKVPKVGGSGKNKKSKKERNAVILERLKEHYEFENNLSENKLLNSLLKNVKSRVTPN